MCVCVFQARTKVHVHAVLPSKAMEREMRVCMCFTPKSLSRISGTLLDVNSRETCLRPLQA